MQCTNLTEKWVLFSLHPVSVLVREHGHLILAGQRAGKIREIDFFQFLEVFFSPQFSTFSLVPEIQVIVYVNMSDLGIYFYVCMHVCMCVYVCMYVFV